MGDWGLSALEWFHIFLRLAQSELFYILQSFYRTYKYKIMQINCHPPLGFEPGSLGTIIKWLIHYATAHHMILHLLLWWLEPMTLVKMLEKTPVTFQMFKKRSALCFPVWLTLLQFKHFLNCNWSFFLTYNLNMWAKLELLNNFRSLEYFPIRVIRQGVCNWSHFRQTLSQVLLLVCFLYLSNLYKIPIINYIECNIGCWKIHPSFHPLVHPTIYLFVHPFLLSTHPSIHPFLRLAIHQLTH